jgi:hypothetical protein
LLGVVPDFPDEGGYYNVYGYVSGNDDGNDGGGSASEYVSDESDSCAPGDVIYQVTGNSSKAGPTEGRGNGSPIEWSVKI